MKNKKLLLTIGWLYPELMNTYGDKGNIICLKKRCEWREIDVEVKDLNVGFNHKLLATCDLLFMGGAQDRQQKIVMNDLKGAKAKSLINAIGDGKVGLYICGAYQFLGKYYKEADGTIINGLGVLDLYTVNPGENHPRLIGNIAISLNTQGGVAIPPPKWNSIDTLVGFENHGGRTQLGNNVKPLGKVLSGYGNNGEDGTEGAIYKNSFGTYLHGPILPKNPHFADLLIKLALEKKYGSPIDLSPLNDSLEHQAHKAVVQRLGIKV